MSTADHPRKPTPTLEEIWQLFWETDCQIKEIDSQLKETDRQIQEMLEVSGKTDEKLTQLERSPAG